jgi:hypothetical protein
MSATNTGGQNFEPQRRGDAEREDGDVMLTKRELAARLKVTGRTIGNWQRG